MMCGYSSITAFSRDSTARMQKKILIIDYTTHHPEVVGALLTLFKAHRVQLAVTDRFCRKYQAPGAAGNMLPDVEHTLIKDEGCSSREWLERLAPLIADQDVVIFSTPIKSPLLAQTLALPGSAKTVLFLHNVNYFLGQKPLDLSTFRRLRAPQRSLLQLLPAYLLERTRAWRREFRLRRQHADFAGLDRKVDFFCFGSDSVANYFQKQSGRTNTALLPTNAGFASVAALPSYQGRLHIAIIGMVSQARKDYLGVVAALLDAQLRRPVTLSLLGSCPDPDFGRQLDALVRCNTNPNLELRFDPDRAYIPTEKLGELLSDVHVLLSPIQPDNEFRFHREVYGLSKVSGSEGDSLAYGRPLLLPNSYACARYIEPLVVPYADMRGLVAAIDALNDDAALQGLYRRLQDVVSGDVYEQLVAEFLGTVLH